MFPFVTEHFIIGDKTITLQLPEENAVQAWYRQQETQAPFPFWARIWPAARALTQYLASHPEYYTDKDVVEFGAGLGLPALFTAASAKNVLITDHADDARHWFNQYHIQQHNNIEYQHFDWYQHEAWPSAECVLLSDVNYKDEDFKGLLNLIQHYTAQQAVMILSTPQRIIARDFVQIIAPYVKAATTMEIDEHTISIYVLG
jgi:predicted nicotinamide N-methyase